MFFIKSVGIKHEKNIAKQVTKIFYIKTINHEYSKKKPVTFYDTISK